MPAPLGAAAENPRWSGNLVDSRPPTRERQRLPPIASGSCATKTLPRNTRRAGSWASSADDTAAAPHHPPHTPTPPPKRSTDPPPRPSNKPTSQPATTRAASAAEEKILCAASAGRV